ncbi:MAG: hypothetical protein IT204_10255 [Fimbriimonadaceae bacterium]|nr:hypothetical protein [Fimbriimonadaceae bacterium]
MRWILCGCLWGAGLAAQAAPDAVLFVREGRVWVLPAGATEPRAALSDDPGWVYAQPTWVDAETYFVMRLKGGELRRSQVGMAGLPEEGEYPAAEVQWIAPAGGAFNLGASTAQRLLAVTKLGDPKEGVFKAFLTCAPWDGDWPKSKVYLTFAEEQSRLLARVRFAADGKRAFVPSFTDAFGVPLALLDVAANKLLTPYWLEHTWLVDHLESPRVSCGAWLRDGRLVLGVDGRGVFLLDEARRAVVALDVAADGRTSPHDLCVGADGRSLYYGVDVTDEDGRDQSEIRYWNGSDPPVKLLANAGWPDAAPAAQ